MKKKHTIYANYSTIEPTSRTQYGRSEGLKDMELSPKLM